jgi:isochorismate synthase EntC
VFNVGAGIVDDSEPRAEFEEIRVKAQPLLEALGVGAVSRRPAVEACALES